jgi:hypothetical protein
MRRKPRHAAVIGSLSTPNRMASYGRGFLDVDSSPTTVGKEVLNPSKEGRGLSII